MDETYVCTMDLMDKLYRDQDGYSPPTNQEIYSVFTHQKDVRSLRLKLNFTSRHKKHPYDQCNVELSSFYSLTRFKFVLRMGVGHHGLNKKGRPFVQRLGMRELFLDSGTRKGTVSNDNSGRWDWNMITNLCVQILFLSPKVFGIARTGTLTPPTDRQTLYEQIEMQPDSMEGRFMLKLVCEQDAEDSERQLFYVHTEVMVEASNVIKTWIQADYDMSDNKASGRPFQVHCSVEALRELLQLVYLQTVSAQFTAHLIDVLTLADYLDMPQVLQACATEIKHDLHYDKWGRVKELLAAICQLSVEEDELCPMALKALLPRLHTGTAVNRPLLNFVNECFKNKPIDKVNGWWLNVIISKDN